MVAETEGYLSRQLNLLTCEMSYYCVSIFKKRK